MWRSREPPEPFGISTKNGIDPRKSLPIHNFAKLNELDTQHAGFVAIAAAEYYSLALTGDGTVVAWGFDDSGQTDIPLPNHDFAAVAAGGHHCLGLKTDGSIVAWGRNVEGQTNVPAPNAGFIAITAGGNHSMGLEADGSIVAWGAGGPGLSDYPHYGQSIVPAPNKGFIAIGGGLYHSLAIRRVMGDADGDDVLDGDDTCLGSDVGETIVIDKCDTGIANVVSDEGCTRADVVAAYADQAPNHGQFVQCVALLANGWKRSGAITDADRGRIMRCAAHAEIPPSDDEETIGRNRAARRPDRTLQRSDTQQYLPLSNGKDGIQKVPGQRGGGP